MPTPSHHRLRELAAGLTDAGLDDGPIAAIVAAALADLDRVVAERAAYEDRGERHSLIRSVADGTLTVTDAAVRFAAVASGEVRKFTAELAEGAALHIRTRAGQELAAIGDGLITEHLAPVHDDAVATYNRLLPAVVGIWTDDEAMAARDDARAAWAELCDTETRRAASVDLVRRLSLCQVRATTLPDTIDDRYRFYRHPDRVPGGNDDIGDAIVSTRYPGSSTGTYRPLNEAHPVRRFAAVLAADAGPGIYTARLATEHATADRETAPAA